MAIKKQPQIRFGGFGGDWEKVVLDEIAEISSGGTPNRKEPTYWNGDIPWVTTSEVNNYIIQDTKEKISELGLMNSSAKIFPINTILMAMYGQGKTRGKVGILGISATTNQACAAIMLNEQNYPEFVYQLLRSKYEFIRTMSNSGGQDNLSASLIKNISFRLPEKPEQIAIGQFFRQLDEMLTLAVQKHAQTVQLKKALLGKLFPISGSLQPQIRLKGFSGDWVERKLGDLAIIRRGASPRPIQAPKWFDNKSEIGWLRISDVTQQNGRIHFLEQRLSTEGQKHTVVLKEPHLLLSIAATVGKPLINYVPTGVHDGFVIFFDLQTDKEFLFQWLENYRSQWQLFGQSGSQVNLNSDLVRSQIIRLPENIAEQTAIGKLFQTLDHTIALQAKEINQIKQLKSALLGKMFV